ncbi:type 1 glutamine amidotransferase domain-containing protein [uncultured Cyclobacterium sp.]|uniref:type 1 glutamine amidotransferase domain-containing protein n=1 Tax=uncultured Cyclobacterium sp. TaxID=453820 RepID=UPI0030ED0DA0|tara:strand:- start:44905 stop:45468 length:564 start_codon:yes stop_codon:yes gene_type:complete
MNRLSDKKIALITENGFEEIEFTSPKKALEDEGAIVEVISPNKGSIKSWKEGNWGEDFTVDKTIDEANSDDYHAVLIPGGVLNPDKLRTNKKAIEFIKDFLAKGKPVASICHGPQVLLETGALAGRKMTSFPSIKQDIINAGAEWIDRECVCDQALVTSRSPKDLEAFNRKMIEEIQEGKHEGQKTL